MQVHELRNRVQAALLRVAKLQGVKSSDEDLQAATARDVALAKGRNNLGPEMARLFEALQSLQNERSVGAYQTLLTAILDDVLPGEGAVRLMTAYKNNATSLDILLEKKGGLEDVLEGNGGAVTNVISTGLRYAALSRTKNRRVVVLDELDCWIKQERVASFVNVIAAVSRGMVAQTFFITHHDIPNFEGKMNIVRFAADEQGVTYAERLEPAVSNWEDDSQPGIRGIELVNFRRHERIFVPGYPGATAYVGDNNLGKSTAITTALRVVAYGESDDSMLRHGCTEAKITIHLEEKQRLEWSRDSNRSPAVMYRLYRGEELVKEGRQPSRNQAPDWVAELLKITRVDDLDLHVGKQKIPVFLLGESGPKRATILSTGKESGYLKALMKEYEEIRVSDRETERSGEMVLARLKEKLRYLGAVDGLDVQMQTLLSNSEAIFTRVEYRDKLEQLLSNLNALGQSVQHYERIFDLLSTAPAMPQLPDHKVLESCIAVIDSTQLSSKLVLPEQLPQLPSLQDHSLLARIGLQISRLTTAATIAPEALPELPMMPSLALSPDLELLIQRLTQVQSAVTNDEQLAVAEQINFETAQTKLQELQTEMGSCPLCGNAFEHSHVHA